MHCSTRSPSLLGAHWSQCLIYEALLFGGGVICTGIALYFKNDQGCTWVESRVEKSNLCKDSSLRQDIKQTIDIIIFYQTSKVIENVLPMPIFTAIAAPFLEETPAIFMQRTG